MANNFIRYYGFRNQHINGGFKIFVNNKEIIDIEIDRDEELKIKKLNIDELRNTENIIVEDHLKYKTVTINWKNIDLFTTDFTHVWGLDFELFSSWDRGQPDYELL